MLSKAQKYLAIFFLFVLTACAPIKPQQPSARPTSSPQPYTTYPPSMSYPKPIQPSKSVTSIETLQQGTPIPSPSPSVLPPPGETTSPDLRITQLQMFDENTGWAVYSTPFTHPEKSKILRTTVGIQNWVDVTPPTSEYSSNIQAAFFVHANTAVVGSTHSSLPELSTVEVTSWRTTDGGHTWQNGEALQIKQASEFFLSQLFFIDPEHGWMLGESDSGMQNMRVHFFETQDGGGALGNGV